MTAPQLAIYKRILIVVQAIGPCKEDPKKTSIHLTRTSAFAGVATRKDALMLTIKPATDIPSRASRSARGRRRTAGTSRCGWRKRLTSIAS